MSFLEQSTAPRRPLADPVWWVALAIWLLNDHFFKGSGFLPSQVTGKLSDLSGLWVLPAGLVALCRGRGGAAWAYLGVGLYFAGLQLWPALVQSSEALLAAMGIPSRITPDPSDLLALLVLWPAWLRYRPQGAPAPATGQLQLRHAMGYALMLIATVATSRVDQPEGVVRTGRVFLYNNTDQPQSITIKEVRDDVEANCFSIQNNPSFHLQDFLFEPVETVRIEAQGLLALDVRAQTSLQADAQDDASACQAMIIGGPNREPKLLFWKSEQFLPQRFVGTPQDLNIEGVIALEPVDAQGETGGGSGTQAGTQTAPSSNQDANGQAAATLVYLHRGKKPILYPTMKEAPALAGPECAPPSPSLELDWGEAFPKGPHRLDRLTPGPDGCIALELSRPSDTEFTVLRYLCIPTERFPFNEGSTLAFRSLKGESPVVGDNVDGWQIAPPDLDTPVKFWVIRGQGLPDLKGLTFGTQVRDECPYAPNKADCATMSRPLDIIAKSDLDGAEIRLRPEGAETSKKLPAQDGEWTLELLQGEERSVFDGACSGDRVRAGREIQLLVTWRSNAK